MSRIELEKAVCPACNKVSDFRVVQSINATLNPDLREKFIRGEINKVTCPHCHSTNVIGAEILYHDMGKGYLIIFGPQGVSEQTKNSWPHSEHFVEYFKYALFADSLEEALMLILYFENEDNTVPQSLEERDTITGTINQLLVRMEENNLSADFASVLLN
jgi:hypothetical protein